MFKRLARVGAKQSMKLEAPAADALVKRIEQGRYTGRSARAATASRQTDRQTERHVRMAGWLAG